jgi:glycosyltransferase involved in cell wall biosynthesis
MKIGIIIIFHNNENDIDKEMFSNLLNKTKLTPLCFVNNGSKDNTLEVLKLLKNEFHSKVSILDVKRNKGTELAIKAGARYLFNTDELNHIGYVNMNSFSGYKDFNKLIWVIESNKDLIIQYNTQDLSNTTNQRKLFKNIFSIVEYLETFHLEYDFNDVDFIAS